MKRLTTVASALALTVLIGCSSDSSTSTASQGGSASEVELTVFAASSLTAAFTDMGKDFETANPGTTVTFNFGSSTDLATQIQSEGTADVFASASGDAMDIVETDPGVTDRQDFATNELVIITPTDNPANITSLDSLTKSGIQLVIGAADVPVGDYTRTMLKNADIESAVMANVVSNEPDDASIVAKITSGEADAGIVYTSDIAAAAGQVKSVEVPADVNVTATYPIAQVTGAPNASTAAAFVSYVLGSAGQATLEDFGFGPPPTG
jgi:molybdate transport system substrate-binding protein